MQSTCLLKLAKFGEKKKQVQDIIVCFQRFVFLDWDDTLFATTDEKNTTKDQWANLETILFDLLPYLQTFGQLHLVTCANKRWVVDSTQKYLPRLHQWLFGTHHVRPAPMVWSARDLHETLCPEQFTLWKTLTFCHILRHCVGSVTHAEIINVGDSEIEHDAVAILRNKLQPMHTIVKTIKFADLPKSSVLLKQLKFLRNHIPKVLVEEKDSAICFDAKKPKKTKEV